MPTCLKSANPLASDKPVLDIQPLGIGGKADPARLLFEAPPGPAICASVIDLGNRFRMIVNEVETTASPEDLPKLPVARALWAPKPDLKTAAACWILGGGAHHTVFSQALTTEYIEDYCEIAGIEMVVIDENTTVSEFKKELRLNELYYHIAKGI